MGSFSVVLGLIVAKVAKVTKVAEGVVVAHRLGSAAENISGDAVAGYIFCAAF